MTELLRIPRTLLLVEDSPEDRVILRRFLQRDADFVYTLVEVALGQQALDLCGQLTPDCILLDYQLPDMDGLVLLQKLVLAALPHVYPVVMLTGTATVGMAVQAMKNGAHDFLSKDHIKPELLQRAVNNAIEKVQLQRQLQVQNEWFHTTLASIGDAVIATDATGCVTFMNMGAEALMGWPISAARGQPLDDLFTLVEDETHLLLENPVRRVLRTGRSVEPNNHVLLLTRDGRHLPIDGSAAPIYDGERMVRGVVLTFRDISDRRRQEALIANHAAQLQLIIDNVAGLIAYVDADQRYRFANAAYETWFGLTPQQVVGRTMREVIGEESYMVAAPFVQQALQGERVWFENEYHHTDGKLHLALVYYVPHVGDESRVSGFYILLTDITERKQAEEERVRLTEQLRQVNETLEQQVVERTIALAQSNQELARSNRELEQFAYIASHDLKSPLRSIDNLAQWVLEDAAPLLPPASQEHLTKLRGRVRRMEKLLEDLLAYSLAGRIHHAAEQVNLAALVQDVLTVLALPSDFTIMVAESLPVVRTERVPLETVLRNLIGNAIKHHHGMQGHVFIAAHATPAGLLCTIRDNGPGIAPVFHGRIFELFQTLQPRDKVEGSGMGLAIVKKIIESRGGTISVESQEGQGATFRFLWVL